MRTLEKQFKDGTYLIVNYAYTTDIDGICDVDLDSVTLYNAAGLEIACPFGTERIMAYVVDDISNRYEGEEDKESA